MKKFVSVILCLLLVLCNVVCLASNELKTKKVEQVYSKMPDVSVYVNTPVSSSDSIKGYIDEKELEFLSVEPFNRDEGVSFVFMFDCSTSVSNSQMSGMKKSVIDFINNDSNANDKFTIVSFGKTIEVLADGTKSKKDVVSAINSMKNNQTATVLFDAVSKAKDIFENADDTYPQKRMCVVFTDAVDYTVGGTTMSELMNVSETAGAPIYVVAINPSNKTSIDVLGQVSRVSGGEICVATNGDIKSAFKKALNSLDTLYRIDFESDTNVAASGEHSLRIWINDECIERNFLTSKWKEDTIPPQVISAEAISGKELKITFSEKVKNAGVAESYTVKKGVTAYEITDVLYDEDTNTAVLSFKNYLGAGGYTLSTANITDNSMEKNLLVSAYSFEISGFKAFMYNILNFIINYWLILAIIGLLVLILVTYIIIKKRKGIVMLDNKATFADNIKYEPVPAEPLPTHFIKLSMETADGAVTNLDINIVQSIIFGRAESCEVTIDDSSMSRQHFAIEVENDMLFIQNLSQTNGTLLNGVELQSKRKLSVGDAISAGQEKFVVKKI